MNQRIEELAEQAGIKHRLDIPNEIWGYDKHLEKFAKLIIKECIKEVSEYHYATIHNNVIPEGINSTKFFQWGYIKGTEKGYNDAIDQIVEGLTSRFDVK